MTPDEIKTLRLSKDYTLSEWARLLGVQAKRAREWERPTRETHRPSPNRIEAMKALPKNPD